MIFLSSMSLVFYFRKYGLREGFQYTEVLALCRLCTRLFWPASGHPCIAENPEYRDKLEKAGVVVEGDTTILVPPQQFLKFFSL